jgi:hypothetical protein
MIDEALDFLRLGQIRSNGRSKSEGRPFVTASDVHDIAKPAEDLIRRYPAATVATAFLVGVVIACWIKRK